MKKNITIVAPSGPVPQVELGLGVKKLEKEGFLVKVHPQCKKRNLFFAGTLEERAQAFFEVCKDPDTDIVLCARGGYGGVHLIEELQKLSSQFGKPAPGKMLVGLSDITTLFQFVKKEWGFSVLHGPMPGTQAFQKLSKKEWSDYVHFLKKEEPKYYVFQKKLKLWFSPKTFKQDVTGVLRGGNLTVIASLVGTKDQQNFENSILFLEDVFEPHYKIHRMLDQLFRSGSFSGVKAIVLGRFTGCKDIPNHVLVSEKSKKTKLLRPVFSDGVGLKKIFSEMGEKLNIPVFYGLPVGHGSEQFSLPMDQVCSVSKDGKMKI